ncbi:hypothetical protein SDRG_08305 [Saprolegnia diclina VS20]|uniref:Uncharacterized protein n=1 Tax=Saprolegnia diclina (strain VS20) TaxID=1156394 RepID=T0QH75_SAPDV|nr:hypothetical protein SDRG_08305 [Saprolegnia diclina VS20]EQC34096.1 hypothetical protein SDRG_08305 [Saprolegnia diclina VS20]|eukprot:XP_008612408.1 hypothetical protein SDRG_08305 [Saprolegnia diclina VS20]
MAAEFDLLAAWGIAIPSPRSSSSMATSKEGYRIIRPTLRPPLPSSVWRDVEAVAPTPHVPPATRHCARLRRTGLCKRPDSMKDIVEQAIVCQNTYDTEPETTTIRDSLRVVRDRTLHKATTTTTLAERLVIEDPECALKRRVRMQPPWPKAYLHAYLSGSAAVPAEPRGPRSTVSATPPAPLGRPRSLEAVASSSSSVCSQSHETTTPLASRVAKTKEMLKVSRMLAKERLAC